MAVPTWTVAQLCAAVGDVIDSAFADELWVRGRIKGLRRSQPGHLYFDLTEHAEDGAAVWDAPKIAVVAFRGRLRGIEAVLAKVGNLSLSDDLDVRIRGRVEYYAPQGRVQFTMNAIDPRHTLGQIAVDRDRVLKALAADGLLDRNGQLSLPPVPLRIGLVTSDGSAAFEDFCHELAATPFGFRVILADARVQGTDAEASLLTALAAAARAGPDVICIVRGGGARTDLLAFDSEAVARAVALSAVPVLVGIGHEVDRSVVDEVAHTSLKTPTACAAALVAQVRTAVEQLDMLGRRTVGAAARRLVTAAARVDSDTVRMATTSRRQLRRAGGSNESAARRLPPAARRALSGHSRWVDGHAGRAVSATRLHLAAADRSTATRAGALTRASLAPLARAGERLDRAASVSAMADPVRVLARGYSITRDAQGRLVRSVALIERGDAIVTDVVDGLVRSTVTDTTTAPALASSSEDQ
jgi:exodeoxyribonuclease VII large subunit